MSVSSERGTPTSPQPCLVLLQALLMLVHPADLPVKLLRPEQLVRLSDKGKMPAVELGVLPELHQRAQEACGGSTQKIRLV